MATRDIAVLLLAVLVRAMVPENAVASTWGSSYGDPAGFCPEQSFLPASYTTVVTNDPSVPNNPEQSTFWGIHANPGYDDWYGYWYGDFAGGPGGDSGWKYIGTSYYGQPALHWNFADYGWQVHGHAKQYIGYYNFTFGGGCGLGWWGSPGPPPYMADVYGYPVVDIYVDSVPPYPPAPRLTAADTTSLSFSWDPVADRGDGAGQDYWAVGGVHYQSWLEVGLAASQWADTPNPRVITATGLAPGQQACVHVRALDALANATAVQVACATTFAPPPSPPAPFPGAVLANPAPNGLSGLDTWFWLNPAPAHQEVGEATGGYQYLVSIDAASVAWDFGDGSSAAYPMPAGAGAAYPTRSPVTHVYERQLAAGYQVRATVTYAVSWRVLAAGVWLGPYPAAVVTATTAALVYPVMQAQPELAPG